MSTQILLVDDHAIVRKGLRVLLEDDEDLKVIGEAEDGEAAVALSRELLPDVIIMDISMKGLNGIEATKQIRKHCPETKIIALSIHSEKHFVEDMLQAGAAGYILKESIPEDLIRGIRAVTNGEGYLSPSIVGIVVSRYHEGIFETQKPVKISAPLLISKLHQPKLSANHLHRSRLLQMLEDKRHLALQNIIAPAGYGKTTLVSCWLNHTDWPTVWYSLDKTDNELRQFLLYFIHALQNLFPDSLKKTSALLISPTLPPNPVLVSHLVNEIQEIKQNFIFVLDDFHLISNLSVHDLLSTVLRYPPDNMHLVIVARRETFLPLSTFRAQGKVNEIRINDLKFSESETREFLQSATKREIDGVTSNYWMKRTEGWITALHLAVLSMSHKSNIITISDKTRIDANDVMEYLNSEVIVQQDPIIQKLLMCTSILNRFCAPLCEAVFLSDEDLEQKQINGKDFIGKLHQNNLFIFDLDNNNYWFRYHHLFQELLQESLAREYSPEYIARLHSHASKWFEGNNLIEEAILHAIAANDLVGAAQIVDKHRQNIHNNDQWYIFEKWLPLFPEEFIQQNKELLICRAWIHYHHFDFRKIPAVLECIQSLSDNIPEDSPINAEISFFFGFNKFFQNEGENSLKYLHSALQTIPSHYKEIKGQIEIIYTLALQVHGDVKEAIDYFEKCLNQSTQAPDIRRTRLLVGLVYILIIAGKLKKARIINQQLNFYSTNHNYEHVRLWSVYLEGMIYFYRGEFKLAANFFKQVVENKYVMHTRAAIDCMAGLVISSQLIQQTDSANTAMQEMFEYSTSLDDPSYLMIIQLCQVRLSILQKKKITISSLANTPQNENMIFWLEIPSISYCKLLLTNESDKNLQEAEKQLLDLLQLCNDSHNIYHKNIVMPILALVYNKQERVNEALDVLKKSIKLTISEHWVQPFIESGTAMSDLLQQLMVKDVTLAEMKEIILLRS